MIEELKPCPFCGNVPSYSNMIHAGELCEYMAVYCEHCQIEGPGFGIREYSEQGKMTDLAIKAWNTRADE